VIEDDPILIIIDGKAYWLYPESDRLSSYEINY